MEILDLASGLVTEKSTAALLCSKKVGSNMGKWPGKEVKGRLMSDVAKSLKLEKQI